MKLLVTLKELIAYLITSKCPQVFPFSFFRIHNIRFVLSALQRVTIRRKSCNLVSEDYEDHCRISGCLPFSLHSNFYMLVWDFTYHTRSLHTHTHASRIELLFEMQLLLNSYIVIRIFSSKSGVQLKHQITKWVHSVVS